MSSGSSRFGNLAQAVRERTASAAAGQDLQTTTAVPSPAGAGIHKPAAALASVAEGLRDRVARLETELAQQTDRNGDLERQLAHARHAVAGAGDALEEFLFLDPGQVNDPLPRDRLPGAFAGPAFDSLLADIQANGQNDAITVRRSGKQGFEIAAGRRRLEVCRLLGLQVLARVRDLDDGAMLRVQFAENERREDISALERAKWFASVRERIAISAKELAAQFGLDPSTLSLYLRLARFPDEISRRLREPQRLSVLRARRVMEAIETTPDVLRRILDALDLYARGRPPGTEIDPDEQIEVVVRAAEGRDFAFRGQDSWFRRSDTLSIAAAALEH